MRSIVKKLSVLVYICIFTLSFGANNSLYFAGAAPGNDSATMELKEISASEKAAGHKPNGFKIVAEDHRMVLYANEKSGEFANFDKSTGEIWFSNPQHRDKDPIANDTGRHLMASQFSLTYYDSANKSYTYNSYENCVSRELLQSKNTKNGVIFYYTLTNYVRTDSDIPEYISVERFRQYFIDGAETEEEKEVLEKRFKLVQDGKYYRKYKIPKYELPIVFRIMDRTGYNSAQLQKDADETKEFAEKVNTPTFTRDVVEIFIPIKVELDNGDVVVSILSDQITSSQKYYVHSIKLLEFYGAPSTTDTGYIFIPDGSGAIINLNNGKYNSEPAIVSVYGNDNNADILQMPPYKEKGLMPVFGIRKADLGILGIIEQGATLSRIQANVSGKTSSYNTVCPEFIYQQMGTVNLGNNIEQIVFQKSPYMGEFKVKYKFLEKGKSTYSDMARVYRDYLFKGIEPLKWSNTPIYVELIGGIEKKKSFFGFSYFADQALTDFSQVRQITEELTSKGVKNLNIKYSGWLSGGIRHYSPSKPKLNKVLGSGKEFSELKKQLSNYGANLFPDVSFVEVYQRGKGFNYKSDAAKYISQQPVRRFDYFCVNGSAILQNDLLKGIPFRFVLAPGRLERTVDKFTSWYKKFNINALSLNDLGTLVVSDENEKAPTNRESTLENALKAIDKLSGYKLMFHEGNSSVLKYATDIVNIPTADSSYAIVDYAVPFYQMVMHGYVNYASSPINLSDDGEHSFLKAVEGGSGIQFKLMYQKSSVLMNTAYTQYFSINYDNWKDEILKYYSKLDSSLGNCYSVKISNHRMIEDGVFETTYENGKKVYVNYNKDIFEEQVDGKNIKIDPVSFVVEG